MREAVDLCFEMLREMPLWFLWAVGTVSLISGSWWLAIATQVLYYGWAPGVSHHLYRRYPTLTKHTSGKWFLISLAGTTVVFIVVSLWPELLQEPAVMLTIVLPLTVCYGTALGKLASTISRLEVELKLADPSEQGRNSFGGFFALFYFAIGGMLSINRRLDEIAIAHRDSTTDA